MKKLIFAGILALLPLGFIHAAAYIKFDGVDGEATTAPAPTTIKVDAVRAETTQTNTSATGIAAPDEPQEGQTDAFLKIKGIDGETTEAKGNVEFEWKVEEGESAAPKPQDIGTKPKPGVEPDEIDFMGDDEPNATNFGVLLGGGSADDEEAHEARAEVAQILLEGAQEEGAPVENLSLNYEKIKAKVAQPVKLLGFIPVTARATVEIDAQERVKVRFPWWAILASGKDSDGVGERTFTTISNVLKTKHDTVKNSIQNMR